MNNVTIDEYSVCTVPIEMFFDATSISHGTAFLWEDAETLFLVTNWHNLSGKNPFTGKHLTAPAAEPNRIEGLFNKKGQLGGRILGNLPLRDDQGRPLWWVHPTYREQIDIVLLPIGKPAEIDPYPINQLASQDLKVQIGMDVFILGYPFGQGAFGLPIWKRGSLASEPEMLSDAQRFHLIDTASRPGMSGSPVIRRSWGTALMANGSVAMGPGTTSKFIGVYSGRLQTADPLDAQLGLMWPAHYVAEIVAGRRKDTS